MALLTRGNVTFYKVPLYVTYVCSKCGSQVVAEHIISESGHSSGAAWNLDKTREKAYHDAAGKMTHKLLDIVEERKEGKYRTAEFNCKCGKCGNREPWSRLRYKNLTDMLLLLFVLTFFAMLYCIMIKNYIAAYAVAGTMAALLIGYAVYRICHTRKMEKLTAALSVKSLPVFSQELDEIVTEALRNSETEHRELYIDKKLQKKMKGRVNK